MKAIHPEEMAVAWRVDAELGYRDAGHRRWTTTRLDELPEAPDGRGMDLASLAGDTPSAPSQVLRASTGGLFRFVSSVRLVVQEYGEPEPRLGQPLEELGPGAVVRCGPLLVSVVDAEMAESLGEGIVALPFIEPCGADAVAAEVPGEQIEAAKERAQRINRRLYAVFFVGFAVLTAAATLYGVTLGIPLKGPVGSGSAHGVNALGGVFVLVPLVWLTWSVLVFPIGWRKRAAAYQEYLRLLSEERPLFERGAGRR